MTTTFVSWNHGGFSDRTHLPHTPLCMLTKKGFQRLWCACHKFFAPTHLGAKIRKKITCCCRSSAVSCSGWDPTPVVLAPATHIAQAHILAAGSVTSRSSPFLVDSDQLNFWLLTSLNRCCHVPWTVCIVQWFVDQGVGGPGLFIETRERYIQCFTLFCFTLLSGSCHACFAVVQSSACGLRRLDCGTTTLWKPR